MCKFAVELAAGKTDKLSYPLLSEWPINSPNAPRTDVENMGLLPMAN